MTKNSFTFRRRSIAIALVAMVSLAGVGCSDEDGLDVTETTIDLDPGAGSGLPGDGADDLDPGAGSGLPGDSADETSTTPVTTASTSG